MAGQIGLTTILVQGFGDLWLALRSYLPRPLDPEKYYQFGQTVKQRFKDEVPWMKNNMNVTFHKVVDHPRHTIYIRTVASLLKQLYLVYVLSLSLMLEHLLLNGIGQIFKID